MDYLDKLTDNARDLAQAARISYHAGHPTESLEHLEKLWDLLCNQFAGNAPRLHGPGESSNGS